MSTIGEDGKHIQGKVYFTRADGTDNVKVGCDANSENLVVEFCYSTHQPVKLETQIHDDLAKYNIRGKWFKLPSNTDYQKIIDNAEQKLNILHEISEQVSRLKKSLTCAKARLQDLSARPPKSRTRNKYIARSTSPRESQKSREKIPLTLPHSLSPKFNHQPSKTQSKSLSKNLQLPPISRPCLMNPLPVVACSNPKPLSILQIDAVKTLLGPFYKTTELELMMLGLASITDEKSKARLI